MTGINKTPLLTVHGFAQTSRSWQSTLEFLGPDRQVLAIELRGHGGTGLARGVPTVASVRTDIVTEINDLGPPVALWGYSQGARASLDLTLEHPELVCGLVLESGTAGIVDPGKRAKRAESDRLLAKKIEHGSIEEFVNFWESAPALSDQSSELVASQREDRLAHDPEALASVLRGIGQASYEPMWGRLSELPMPVLVLTGARDTTYSEIGERLTAAIPIATHEIVGGAGHAVHLERPDLSARIVEQFLELRVDR